jgi:hypothetical protein
VTHGTPQICQDHDLKDMAQPVCEADRHVKKELKKKVRGVRDLERHAEKSRTKEAPVVADYCLAIRTVMRDEEKYPLDPPGVKLSQQLQLMAASGERVMVVHPSALLKKLSRMRTVLNLFQQKFEQLMILFSGMYHIAHLLKTDRSYEDAQSHLLTCVHQLQHRCPHEELLSLVAYVEKMTVAFTPHLFDYLQQPRLPRTTNDLDLLIGRIKKSRRHVPGRKNTQEFREGCCVAILFGFPQVTNGVDVFAQVNPHDFYHPLNLLRQPDMRCKCWQVRRNLGAFLAALEQPWVLHE